MGQERVSAVKVITELLSNSQESLHRPYSSVTLDSALKDVFLAQTAINKEVLGQPLMLAITFMDICVKGKSAAYKAITLKGK